MGWLRALLQMLVQSPTAAQGYALLLLGTSVTVAGAMFITAEVVLDQVSLNALQHAPITADLGAFGAAPYSPDAADQRFRGLRAEVAEEARRDSAARASSAAQSSGGFGFSPETLSVLLDPSQRLPATAPAVQNLPAPAATAAPAAPGAGAAGPVLVQPVGGAPTPAPTPPPAPSPTVPVPTTLPTPVIATPVPTVVVALPPTPLPTAPPPAPTATPAGPQPPPVSDPEPPPAAPPAPTPTAVPVAGTGAGETSAPSAPSAPPAPTAAPPPAPTAAPTAAPEPTTAPPTPAPTPSATAAPIPAPTQTTEIIDINIPGVAQPEVGIDLRAIPGLAGSEKGTGPHSGSTIFDLLAAGISAPGETATATFYVANHGKRPFRYTLTTTSTAPPGADNRLFTDPVNGLQLKLTRVTTEARFLVYEGPVKVANLDMKILVLPGTADRLEIQMQIAPSADNSFMLLTSPVTFTWTATEATQ